MVTVQTKARAPRVRTSVGYNRTGGHVEDAMSPRGRALAATLVLSGLREAWSRIGVVFDTAPIQVVDRLEEVASAEGFSPGLTVP
jgi:hypothetical protein